MKTLSIQQPWASLIAYGIKDVENRSWATPFRGKILIHASGKLDSNWEKTNCEAVDEIYNAQRFGNFPDMKDLPKGAIIGYVTLKDCIEECEDSIWAMPATNWILEDAYIFDEPITGVKGKLNLWDYPEIDPNNLPPAHKIERRTIKLDGGNLIVPVTEASLNEALANKKMILAFTSEVCTELINENDEFLPILTITFVLPDGTKSQHNVTEVSEMGYVNEEGEQLKRVNWYFEEVDHTDLGIFFE